MMNKSIRMVVSILMSVLLIPAIADEPTVEEPQAAAQFATTSIEKLGDERYRIGAITVDRKTASFSVPGKLIHLESWEPSSGST